MEIDWNKTRTYITGPRHGQQVANWRKLAGFSHIRNVHDMHKALREIAALATR